MNRRPQHSKRGVYLLEVTAAMAVLSIGIMGTLQLFHVGIKAMQTAEEGQIAMRAIENELETLRAMPSSLHHDTMEQAFISNTPEIDWLHGARSVVTTEPGPEKTLAEVRVRIDWIGDKGRVMHREVIALIPKRSEP